MAKEYFTSGEHSWVVPAGVTSIRIEAWGGGGAGGGTTAEPATGGGGAGGCFASSELQVEPGQEFTIRVGAGGTPSSSTGGKGGLTSFLDRSEIYLVADGGNGGGGTSVSYVNSSPALGNLGETLGDIKYKGGNGSYGMFDRSFSGGGGGAGNLYGNGENALGDKGGKSVAPGGDGADGVTSTSNGNPGFTYGGGGSGGMQKTTKIAYVLGGAGGDGYLIVSYDVGQELTGEVNMDIPPLQMQVSGQLTIPVIGGNKYDTGLFYDTECPACSAFNLDIIDVDGKLTILDNLETDEVLKAMLLKLIEYLSPINAKLNTLTYTGPI